MALTVDTTTLPGVTIITDSITGGIAVVRRIIRQPCWIYQTLLIK